MYVYACVRMGACMYVCVYAFMCLCMFACTYVGMCAHIVGLCAYVGLRGTYL